MDQSSSGQTPKRAARRVTDARREQNRIASRIYRERRKQKLALLDDLISPENALSGEALGLSGVAPSTSLNTDAPQQATTPTTRPSAPTPLEPVSHDAPLSNIFDRYDWVDTLPISPAPVSSTTGNVFSASDFSKPVPGTQVMSTSELMLAASSSSTAEPTSMALTTVSPRCLTLMQALPWVDPSSSTSNSVMAAAARQVVDNLDATMDRIPLTPMDQTLFNILREVQHLSETQRRELIGYLKRTTNEHEVPPHRAPANWISPSDGKGGTRRDTIRSKLQGEARRFASFLDRQASAKLNPAQLSRLYVLEVGFYGAVFANCYALGMSDLEPLMVEEGCSIFSINQDMGYHQSQLDVVRAKFKAITQDLRPSDAQLTIGHHPYLDVIPFKVFRENALKALELGPQALDEDQLCADFGAGGLVCWGSQQNSLGMEAGVPWDARSWEPQVWFLKKYRHLCGGWDDEMWMAARRWHSIRGETIRVN